MYCLFQHLLMKLFYERNHETFGNTCFLKILYGDNFAFTNNHINLIAYSQFISSSAVKKVMLNKEMKANITFNEVKHISILITNWCNYNLTLLLLQNFIAIFVIEMQLSKRFLLFVYLILQTLIKSTGFKAVWNENQDFSGFLFELLLSFLWFWMVYLLKQR